MMSIWSIILSRMNNSLKLLAVFHFQFHSKLEDFESCTEQEEALCKIQCTVVGIVPTRKMQLEY